MSKEAGKAVCGIIMPISAIDGCSESHWSDIQDILVEAIEGAGFEANLVSNADEVGVIHKRIIQNLYENPIVVCDVSGKNPNVMFELGMRLAFDKPTIVVKDDQTAYSFDTSAIEHIEYPRDLRFARIVEFKEKLAAKISATHEKAAGDPNYTTFLKHFGEFKVAKIEKKEVSGQEYILDELRSLRFALRRIERNGAMLKSDFNHPLSRRHPSADLDICLRNITREEAESVVTLANSDPHVNVAELDAHAPDHFHLIAHLSSDADHDEVRARLGALSPKRRDFRRTAPKG